MAIQTEVTGTALFVDGKPFRDGLQPVTTKVSRQEELLFGHYAPLVRRAGQLATEAELLRSELEQLLAASREADPITVKNADGVIDGLGISEHTIWLDKLYSSIWALVDTCYASHQNVARECLDRWIAFRAGIDSQPSVDQSK